MPVETLQRALDDSGLTASQLAARLGWYSANASRVRRQLGLKPHQKTGGQRVPQRRVPYSRAVEIVRALDLDPVDYGL